MGQICSKCFGSKSSANQDGGGATAQLGTTSNPSPAQGSGGWLGAGGGGGGGGGPAPPPLPIPPNERCVLEGPGLQQVAGFAGESTHFMVACFKEGGGEFDHFVVSNLIVEITGPATLEPTVAATKIGAKVSYTARKAGNYSISIKYFGDDLPGSPMPVSILAGKIDGSRSHIEQPSGLVQGVIVLPLFMEQRIKIVTRDACDNERDAGGLARGFGLITELVAEDCEEETYTTRTENEDKAWRFAKSRPHMSGTLRKKRFGGFAGWEMCYFCLAGDALFYAASPSDSQPRGVLYLEGCRVRDHGGGSFEVFVPLAYSRANVVKEKQVNRIFTLGAVKGDAKVASQWIKAISAAKPLEAQDLLEARDAHAEGRGFSAGDIAKLRDQIAAEEKGQAVNQVEWENLIRAEAVRRREEETSAAAGGGRGGGAEAGGGGGGGLGGVEEAQSNAAGDAKSASPDEVEIKVESGGGGLTSKQARVQAAMRDTSLTPQERQKRIQEIMREPAEPAKEEEGGNKEGGGAGGGGGGSKQARIQAVMRDTSISAAERQRRIGEIMRGGGEGEGGGGGGGGGEGISEEEKERKAKLAEKQKRVARLIAEGKAEIGKPGTVKGGGGGVEAAADREVDVRVILGGLDEDTGMGDEDMIGLGSVSGSLTVRDVKASASFGLQQLGVGARIVDYTPDRTRLIVSSSGQVLADEDVEVRFVAPSAPSLMLLLVPREMEASIRAALASKDVTGPGGRLGAGSSSSGSAAVPSSGPRTDNNNNPGAFRVSSRVDDGFEVLSVEAGEQWEGGEGAAVRFTNTSCPFEIIDNFNGTYWMSFSFVARGVYKATVTYHGVPLKGATFQVIVLRPEAYLRIKTAVKRPRGESEENIGYSAMLLGEREQWTNVMVRFNHRQMAMYKAGGMGIIEAITGLKLGGRVHTVPIRNNVKFYPLANGPKVSVSDGSGIELCLSSPERTLVQATFYMLLHARMSGAGGSFEQRRVVLYRQIKRMCPPVSGAQVVRVRRAKLLQDAMEKCSSFTEKEWRQDWQIRFEGEQGVDWGGLQREFFEILGREIFSTKAAKNKPALFAKMGTDSGPLIHPNIHSGSDVAPFRFAGRVMGKCLYDSAVRDSHHLLTVHLTRSFLKMILGVPISYYDFEKDDPQLFKSKIQFMIQNDITDAGLDLTMSEEHYAAGGLLTETVELVPGGAKVNVTDANKKMYLTLLARHRLGLSRRPYNTDSLAPQVKAFVEGFYSIVSEGLLETFDDNELELLVCGMPEVSVPDFKNNTAYPGIRDPFNDPIVRWFWTCVENMNGEERARLLQFVTGSSQVPSGGFKTLEPKINIKMNHSPPSHLPVSHTCFNTLELPRYRSFEQLQERLALAIKEGAEGFGEA